MSTQIEWAANRDGSPGVSWNPITGCVPISTGCRECYAKREHERRHKAFLAGKPMATQYTKPFEVVQLHPDRVPVPLSWRTPRTVFFASGADPFHEDVPFEFLNTCMGVVKTTPDSIYILLTKRAERMRAFGLQYGFPRNLVLGVSVENQEQADARIPLLLQTPAATRCISAEPLLGPIDLKTWANGWADDGDATCYGCGYPACCRGRCGDETGLHWVIAGGESGTNARPAHPYWFQSLRQQCACYEVPFFFKQWGSHGATAVNMTTGEPVFRMFENYMRLQHKGPTWIRPGDVTIDYDGKRLATMGEASKATYPLAVVRHMAKDRAGRLLDGREWNERPAIFNPVGAQI